MYSKSTVKEYILSLELVYRCDCGCKQAKGENNHWTLLKWTPRGPIFLEWDQKMADSHKYMFLAGDACCTKVLNIWLEGRKQKDTKPALVGPAPDPFRGVEINIVEAEELAVA